MKKMDLDHLDFLLEFFVSFSIVKECIPLFAGNLKKVRVRVRGCKFFSELNTPAAGRAFAPWTCRIKY